MNPMAYAKKKRDIPSRGRRERKTKYADSSSSSTPSHDDVSRNDAARIAIAADIPNPLLKRRIFRPNLSDK